MAQASYPHYPVSPRIHLLGLDFVFNTYSTGSSYRLSREHKPSDLTPAPHDTSHLHRSSSSRLNSLSSLLSVLSPSNSRSSPVLITSPSRCSVPPRLSSNATRL